MIRYSLHHVSTIIKQYLFLFLNSQFCLSLDCVLGYQEQEKKIIEQLSCQAWLNFFFFISFYFLLILISQQFIRGILANIILYLNSAFIPIERQKVFPVYYKDELAGQLVNFRNSRVKWKRFVFQQEQPHFFYSQSIFIIISTYLRHWLIFNYDIH